jgi:hypothetical protein
MAWEVHNRESGGWAAELVEKAHGGNHLRRRPFIMRADNGAVHGSAGSAGHSFTRTVQVSSNRFGRQECLEEMLRLAKKKNIHVKLRPRVFR